MSKNYEVNRLPVSSRVPFRPECPPTAYRSRDGRAAGPESSPGWALEQSAFNLLNWLAADLEMAGQQYELIRQKLITLFRCRACAFPDELADETINRVIRKLPQIKSGYVGSPTNYFYGVAKKVYMEHLRPVPVQKAFPLPAVNEELEDLLQRLDEALSRLSQEDRDLVLSYYREDSRSKIDHRKDLARQLGVNLNTLRLRIYRIRSQIRSYLEI